MTKNALRLLLAAPLLSACALMPEGVGGGRHPMQIQPPAKRLASYCHLQSCDVTVTVDANCLVTANPYTLVIGGGHGPFTVVWKLNGPGAAFASGNGIVFEPGAAGVFTKVQGGSQSYVFQNTGTKGIYHYVVNVVQDGTACPTLDPTDVNDL
jgi:hypothetical protein